MTLSYVWYACSMRILYLFFFFFFQAEDGIRDYKVTGVQTCALPICTSMTPKLFTPEPKKTGVSLPARKASWSQGAEAPWASSMLSSASSKDRSEEHTSELQSPCNIVCRLLLEKKKNIRHCTRSYQITPL